jgi:excisionase family DNA binding protein
VSDQLLTPEEVADLFDVSPQTLASWRTTGRYDLPFLKIGRLVRYRASDVEEFLDGLDADDAVDLDAEDPGAEDLDEQEDADE